LANTEQTSNPKELDSDQIEYLFREHNRALLGLLTARLGCAQAAKEVAQEAYVRLLNLNGSGPVNYQRAYLFKVAQNLATDRLRHEALVTKHNLLQFFDEEDASIDPERSCAAHQEVQFLHGTLRELPPKCRLAFTMHRYQGMALSEVASEMKLSERMVRIYVGRALAYCQSRLDEHGGFSDG
jgi:RNA polymerase sigma-70 factor (ECF subfamily)